MRTNKKHTYDTGTPVQATDSVVPDAVRAAVEATEPPRKKRVIGMFLVIVVCVMVAVGAGDTTFEIVLYFQQHSQHTCSADATRELREAADADRKANDDLFQAVLGPQTETRAQVQAAYAAYKRERAANDAKRVAIEKTSENC